MGGLDIAFDNASRVPSHQRSRRHIPYNDARRRNDAIVPDSYSRQNYRVRADEAVVTNVYVTITLVDIVVRQDGSPEGDNRVLPDVDSAGIGLVELRTEGNSGSFPDLHLPSSNEVLATEFLRHVTQRLTDPRR